MGFCSGCGQPLTGRFCKLCGKPAEATQAAPVQPPPAAPYANSQAAPYMQYAAPSGSGGNKPSGMRTILFWLAWGVLAMLSGLMLLAGFSPVRLVGFGALALLPLLTRKSLFKKFLPSLLSWVGIFVTFGIVVTMTGGAINSPASNRELLSTQTQGGVSVSVLEGTLPEGASISVKADNTQPVTSEGVTARAYNITLPSGVAMDGVAEIRLPIDKSLIPSGLTAADTLAAAYFDPQTNAWVPVLYYVDGDEVVIITDHFSRYGVLYFKDGRKKLAETLPAFDSMPSSFYSVDELNKVVNDIAAGSDNSAIALEKGWSEFNTYYGLTGASSSVLQAATGAESLSSLNNLMNEVGMGFALTQLACDIYKGDTNAAVTNLTKNSAFYAASKWGGKAIGLASAGVTFIDIATTKFAEKALEKNLQKWEDAYRHYYNTNPGARRSAVDWYKIVKQLHGESKSTAEFQSKLDAALTSYCDTFWKDAEGYAYVAESTPGIVGFGAGGEYAQGVSELSARYKAFLYHTTMQSVMATYTKNLWLNEYMKASANFDKLKAEMNKRYTVTVSLQNAQSVKNLAGTTVRFMNSAGTVVHSQSFDASGKVVLNTTLFGFLKTGGPMRITVNVPAQDNTPAFSYEASYKLDRTAVSLSVPYVPQAPPTTTTTKPVTTTTAKPATVTTTTAPPISTTTSPATTTKPPTSTKDTYNYAAALAAWKGFIEADAKSRAYTDDVSSSTFEIEWVVAPKIVDGQVVGAHILWQTKVYFAGENKGRTVRWEAYTFFDAKVPGVYMSVGELRAKYPQFGG
ncbi:MAG: hypothetical protein C4542_05265 [Dehalococcoidia bacterium]|nr:MAG: hypothetical protein C4542_05265 [Dehalococcoidia bacterium]